MKESPGHSAGRWTRQNLRERLQSRKNLSGIKLIFAWLVLGTLMLIGFFVGLVFLLLGWILMPLLRYGWVKRARRQGAGGQFEAHSQPRQGPARVIEGEYQVRKSDPSE